MRGFLCRSLPPPQKTRSTSCAATGSGRRYNERASMGGRDRRGKGRGDHTPKGLTFFGASSSVPLFLPRSKQANFFAPLGHSGSVGSSLVCASLLTKKPVKDNAVAFSLLGVAVRVASAFCFLGGPASWRVLHLRMRVGQGLRVRHGEGQMAEAGGPKE